MAPRTWVWVAALAALGATGCSWDWDVLEPRAVVADAGDAGTDMGPADTGGTDAPPVDAPDAGDTGCACAPGQTCCAGACVMTQTDVNNCGACGTRCPGTACLGGACSSTCLLGRLDCDRNAGTGCEVDALTDGANCGACGVACPTGRACVMGMCACPGRTADCDGNPSNGCEVDLTLDPNHCGMCGARCPAGQACATGACTCGSGTGDCDADRANGCETNLQTAAAHCGGCGRSCGAGAVCAMGRCECTPGALRCPETAPSCAVSALDPRNCGACGRACDGLAPLCSARGCVAECATGETRCGMACADLATSPVHCGACGRACGPHQRCGGATPACACETGWGDCDGDATNGCETDLATSGAHCGACGTACGAGRACAAGVCGCTGGLRDCGGGRCAACCGDGDCSDGEGCTVDRCEAGTCTHTMCARCCGSTCRDCCGDADCSMNRGCGTDGTCSTCASGFGDCDGNAANGCETRTDTTSNCGTCGTACSFANAAATCAMGRCAMGACAEGFADCDMDPANGCETNLQSSVAHCGRCANACMFSGGTPACIRGTCQRTSCEMGLGDCDGNTANGCEANLRESAAHCGACGNACVVPQATPACRAGACAVGTCNTGSGDCDGMVGNGCEVNLQTAPAHCGMCGRACTFPNATPLCTAGACALGACRPGFGNCDAMAATGCETNLQTTVTHCGTCGTVCPARPNARTACVTGTCGFVCNENFADCDGSPANGCETDLTSSAPHCGGCGRTCAPANATAVCVGGSCEIGACVGAFQNCNRSALDGCEVDTQNDPLHCGACGRGCSLPNATPGCAAGACRVAACSPGFGNCDAIQTNGCEANLVTSTAHCGACGNACPTGYTCTAGLCARPITGYTIVRDPPGVTWVEACSAAGMVRGLNGLDDALSVPLRAPFPLEFWGARFNDVVMSTNGWIGFGAAGVNWRNDNYGAFSLPSPSAPFSAAFVYSRDLVMGDIGVCLATVGTAPNRRWVLETYDARFFGDPAARVTFEMILNEGNPAIDFLYNPPFAGPGTDGASTTVGLHDPTGTRAVVHSRLAPGTITSMTRLRFVPMP